MWLRARFSGSCPVRPIALRSVPFGQMQRRAIWLFSSEKESKLNAKERALKAAGAPDANNDPDEYNLIYIVVDKSHKISLSVFLRCLGLDTNEKIIEMFGDEECLICSESL